MSRIIFDIETSGFPLRRARRNTQLRWAERQKDDIKDVKGKPFILSPNRREVITIGILNPDTDKGAVYFQSPRNTNRSL